MFDVSAEEITEGSLGRALAYLSVPIVVQQFALVTQQVVDVFWLGRLSPEAVAAVGLVAPLIGLLVVPSQAVYIGSQVLVSQRLGTDDRAGARRAAFHGLVGATTVMSLLAVVVNGVAFDLAAVFDPGPRVARLAATYLGALAFAYVVTAASDSVEAAFTGAGDSRTPLVANLVAIGTNVVLDPFLIFGWYGLPRLGVAGAAYATLVGYALGAVVMLAAAVSDRGGLSLGRDAVGLDAAEFRALVDVGAPKAGQSVGRQAARLVMVAIVSATGGAAALTAYTVGARVSTVAFVPAIGIGSASTTLVGQNLGAARPDRATRATWLGVGAGAVGIGALGGVQWLCPDVLAALFVPGIAGEALVYTTAYLQILAYGYWALGAVWTVEAGFNGAGRTDVTMYSTLLQYWTVRVPVAAVGAFVLGYGTLGPFWAVTVSNVVAAVGLCAYFRYSTGAGMLDRAADDATAAD